MVIRVECNEQKAVYLSDLIDRLNPNNGAGAAAAGPRLQVLTPLRHCTKSLQIWAWMKRIYSSMA